MIIFQMFFFKFVLCLHTYQLYIMTNVYIN